MRKIREVLRLTHELGLGVRQVFIESPRLRSPIASVWKKQPPVTLAAWRAEGLLAVRTTSGPLVMPQPMARGSRGPCSSKSTEETACRLRCSPIDHSLLQLAPVSSHPAIVVQHRSA